MVLNIVFFFVYSPSFELKEPMNWGEHQSAFGTQKQAAFNGKNSHPFVILMRSKDMNRNLHKIFFI